MDTFTPPPGMPTCVTEDIEGAPDCYWDATVHGNGTGRSFVWQDGFIIYTDGLPAPGEESAFVAPSEPSESTLTPSASPLDAALVVGVVLAALVRWWTR